MRKFLLQGLKGSDHTEDPDIEGQFKVNHKEMGREGLD
jgi:hypothetical protein